ncbi:MAG: DUF1501 domain-containing protein [Planctomycetes bacterium]|nr:DUF1501 domain-containing protein [Planctomycetota bacterium]
MRPRGISRREVLRIGGSSLLGLGLADLLALKANAATRLRDGTEGSAALAGSPGFGRAQSIILVYLQGGPSHLDLWDPKEGCPADVQSVYKRIASNVPGIDLTENLPRLAQVVDKLTLIRSMSYSPNGLFNHTAAIYQMLTGYTADKVSPSGQLEPPTPKDFPNFGSHLTRLKPVSVPMLPFVMLPRPLQESGVIGKAGTAGYLGRAFDPYFLYPPGDDFDVMKLDRIRVDDLAIRPELSVPRLERRAQLRTQIDSAMPEIDKAVEKFDLDEYTAEAMSLILSGRARRAFDLKEESDATRDQYGRHQFGQSCLLARRFVEAGSRVVQVNWPKVANSDFHSWDMHVDLPQRLPLAAPMLDSGLSTLIADLDQRGLLETTLVVCVAEFGRSPKRGVSTSGNANNDSGRDHWPYCFTAVAAGAGIRRGHVHGESDKTGSAPIRDAMHPTQLLATIYHAFGIDPATLAYNHLNQPRELVQAAPVTELFA